MPAPSAKRPAPVSGSPGCATVFLAATAKKMIPSTIG